MNNKENNSMDLLPDDPGDTAKWYATIPQPSPSASIWRYMDFTKFMYLIEKSTIFFSRIDLLGDPFEATVPQTHAAKFQELISDNSKQEYFRNAMRIWRTYLYVSCWHLGNHEDAALWRLYGQENRCIAVKTQYSKLQNLPHVKTGQITYLDYSKEQIPQPPMDVLAMHKRHHFQSEREVRAIVSKVVKPIPGRDESHGFLVPSQITGIPISVDLREFIQEIVVSPTAEEWFYDLTREIISRYALGISVRRSEMIAMPSLEGVGLPMSTTSQTNYGNAGQGDKA